MKKDILAAGFVVLMITVIAIGCRREPAPVVQTAGRHLLAISNEVTVGHMNYLTRGGAFLMFAGVVAVAFGKRVFGGTLFVGGGMMLGYFTYLAEMPWMIAALIALASAVFILWLWQTGRLRGTLKETITAIQSHDEVKAEMCGGDVKRQAKARKVIDPIKKELRDEGRI